MTMRGGGGRRGYRSSSLRRTCFRCPLLPGCWAGVFNEVLAPLIKWGGPSAGLWRVWGVARLGWAGGFCVSGGVEECIEDRSFDAASRGRCLRECLDYDVALGVAVAVVEHHGVLRYQPHTWGRLSGFGGAWVGVCGRQCCLVLSVVWPLVGLWAASAALVQCWLRCLLVGVPVGSRRLCGPVVGSGVLLWC